MGKSGRETRFCVKSGHTDVRDLSEARNRVQCYIPQPETEAQLEFAKRRHLQTLARIFFENEHKVVYHGLLSWKRTYI